MRRVLDVSSSGYCAWLMRAPSAGKIANEGLLEEIRTIHKRSVGTYGVPRVQAELRDQGVSGSRKCIARLMRRDNLQGVSRRRSFKTTKRDPKASPVLDLVERNLSAKGCRTSCGWATSRTSLLTPALSFSSWSWMPSRAGSSAGLWPLICAPSLCSMPLRWLFTSEGRRMSSATPTTAANTPRSPSANAVARLGFVLPQGPWGMRLITPCARASSPPWSASFLTAGEFHSHSEAKMAIFTFIEGWCNPSRRHSGLDYLSPMEYERRHMAVA
jgi:putative transposase